MILVRINCPDDAVAMAIARAAVDRRLAACANVEPGIRSVYRWNGRIEEGAEIVVLLKTREALFDRVAALVRELHPDEVPAILALPVPRVAPDFGAWVEAETGD